MSTAPKGSSSTPSSRLIARARQGDRTALGRLVGRCVPQLERWAHRRLARWVRTVADTPDVVHDAILHTLRRSDRIDLRSQQALAAYLRKAVDNRIKDEHRRFATRGDHDPLSDALIDSAPSPLERTLVLEREARYRSALMRLDAPDRELIVAHVELDYTHAQLACMSGRSPNAARMALRRAICRLAEEMNDV